MTAPEPWPVTVVLFLGFGVATLATAAAISWMMFSYELLPDRIRVRLFHAIPIFTIWLADIISIEYVGLWSGGGWMTIRFINRFTLHVVAIERSDGFFRFIRITPPRPEEFIAEVRAARAKLRLEDTRRQKRY